MGILSYVAGKLQSNSVQVALVDDVIGVEQTWQDMTASRAVATNYTNTTGKPIQVYITVVITGSGANGNIIVDGVTIGRTGYSAGAAIETNVSFIVPNGSVYQLSSGGSILWFELREVA